MEANKLKIKELEHGLSVYVSKWVKANITNHISYNRSRLLVSLILSVKEHEN